MDNRLYVEIQYNVPDDKFCITRTNIRKDSIQSIVSNFLRSQIGGGQDKSPVNEQNVYTIELQIDLSDDSFYCAHNCGNRGLREGILMHFCSIFGENRA